MIIAAIHVVVIVLVPIANSFYCNQKLPDKFSEVPNGKFSSDVTRFISGKIFINGDFSDMVCGETREVEVAIYYNLWSFYRPGQVVRTQLACTVYDNQIQGDTDRIPTQDTSAPRITILALPGESLVGVYKTANPGDHGHFTIQDH